MLELFGSGYVMEHCVSAFSKLCEEKTFRNYIADCQYATTNIIYRRFGGTEDIIETRYCDLSKEKKPQETAEQIKKRMLKEVRG